MNYTMLALCAVFSTTHLGANTRGFAPYDKERGFSLDTRFGGTFLKDSFESNAFIFILDINGYYKGSSGWFGKLGVNSYISRNSFRQLPLPLPNLQVGRYREGVGAFRFGLFHGFPGVGGDYWLMYDRFKWLTTLETSWYIWPRGRDGIVFNINWLNRFFLTDEFYISGGISYFAEEELRGITFGSLGIGVAF